MDSKRIEELLVKYWDGETSLEEEAQLREYFRQPVADQWKETAALFRYFDEERKKSLNDVSFDEGVFEKAREPKRATSVNLVQNTIRMAAGIAVLLAATWFIYTEVNKQQKGVIEDPKVAFEETKKALLMISSGFNKAEEQAKKIDLFNEAQQEIHKKKNDNIQL